MEVLKMILRRLFGIEKKEYEDKINELENEVTNYEFLLKRINTVCGQNEYSCIDYKIRKIKELIEGE